MNNYSLVKINIYSTLNTIDWDSVYQRYLITTKTIIGKPISGNYRIKRDGCDRTVRNDAILLLPPLASKYDNTIVLAYSGADYKYINIETLWEDLANLENPTKEIIDAFIEVINNYG